MPLVWEAVIGASSGERNRGGHADATRCAGDGKRAAKRGHSLTYPGQAKAGGLCDLGRIPAAVVLDADQQRIVRSRPPLDPEHDLARCA